MDFINPIQPIKKNVSEISIKKTISPLKPQSQNTKKRRAKRSDSTHSIKFPVDPIERMKLKSYFKQAQRILHNTSEQKITQTQFNTLILRFGLGHLSLVDWTIDYKDSKYYMHTNLLEYEYEDIGGPHGLAVRKNLSNRKVVYFIVSAVIRGIERGEVSLEKVIQ